jgi:hypothetical protein
MAFASPDQLDRSLPLKAERSAQTVHVSKQTEIRAFPAVAGGRAGVDWPASTREQSSAPSPDAAATAKQECRCHA